MQNPFLAGEHIYLRPLEPGDAPTLTPWFNDAEVTRNLLRGGPMSQRAEEEWLAKVGQGDEAALGIVLRDGDRLIGSTGLHKIDWRNRHAAFGIAIGVVEEWGKGYGAEATRLMVQHAFATLNLNRVWLEVYEFNQRGIRAYEKVGFQIEGRLRQHTFRDGRYWDVLVMGVLREEWTGDKATATKIEATTK
jgi:RimJ/RimL family protein N-acetyltransferase